MNTLNMLVKDKCTGCNACGNSCPVDAIKLVYNKDGLSEEYRRFTDN